MPDEFQMEYYLVDVKNKNWKCKTISKMYFRVTSNYFSFSRFNKKLKKLHFLHFYKSVSYYPFHPKFLFYFLLLKHFKFVTIR